MKRRLAIFLDRDGVLNKDVGYPHRLSDAVLYEDVIPAFRKMQHAGYILLIVSNQSGVARGLFSLDAVLHFNDAIAKQLRKAGIRISRKDFYVCPHAPVDGCNCRKPQPGLLLQAAHQHRIDLANSFTVGDTESDIEAGRRAGTHTILLNRNGERHKTKADSVAASLLDVALFVSSARRDSGYRPFVDSIRVQ